MPRDFVRENEIEVASPRVAPPMPIGHQRLLRLADFLETVPPAQFDMRMWWCGSRGCALGWACTIPEFVKAGLHLNDNGEPAFNDGEETPFSAAESFFNLDQDGWHLFCADPDPDVCGSPTAVAADIRAYVAARQGA